MNLELPPSFGSCVQGQRINVVGKLLVWDASHDGHLFRACHDSSVFHASGLLDGTGDLYSLINVEFRQQYPVPIVDLDVKSHVFRHPKPSWDSLHQVIDVRDLVVIIKVCCLRDSSPLLRLISMIGF